MKKYSTSKLALFLIVLTVIGIGFSGCVVPPPITSTGTAKIIVSGSYYYNIKMDGITQFGSRSSGTYTLTGITAGNHKFEAIDTRGEKFGYDSQTIYISAGLTTTVYLNPKETSSYGTAKIIVTGDYLYNISMDDIPQWESVPAGTYTLTKIPVGSHKFEAIDIDGSSFGYDSQTVYIYAGTTTTVNLKPSTPSSGIGSLEVTIMDDPGYKYYVYLGTNSSGTYLGMTSGGNIYNSLMVHNIPSGTKNIYVVSADGYYSAVRSVYIQPNSTNILEIWVKPF